MRRPFLLAAFALSAIAEGCSSVDAPEVEAEVEDLVGGNLETAYEATGFLYANSPDPGNLICTGTLVRKDAVLTAAHCVEDGVSPYYLRFSLGDTKKVTGTYGIRAIYSHPAYEFAPPAPGATTSTEIRHDLAILRLDREVEGVKLATIVPPPAIGPGYRYVGYGQTVDGGPSYGSAGGYGQRKSGAFAITEFDDLHITARSTEAGNCWGDSGGPLYRDGTRELVGVLWGFRGLPYECEIGKPMGYTNVSAHLGFVRDALACDVSTTSNYFPPSCQHDLATDPGMGGEPKKKWELRLGDSTTVSQVAVSPIDGRVYASTSEGLLALDSAGTVIWRAPIPQIDRRPGVTGEPIRITPDGTAIVLSGETLHAIAPNGTERWTREGAHRILVGTNGTTYVASGNELLAIRANGAIAWTTTLPSGIRGLGEGPTGVVFAVTEYGSPSADGRPAKQLFEVNGATGALNTPVKLEIPIHSNLAFSNGVLFYAHLLNGTCDAIELVAVNRAGIKQWVSERFDPEYGRCSAFYPPVIAPNGNVLFQSTSNLVSFTTTGTVAWRQRWETYGNPAIKADGSVYTVSVYGRFYTANANGVEGWKYMSTTDSGESFTSQVALGADGTLVVGRVRNILALTPP